MTRQSLQFAEMRWRRLPGRWLLLFTEAADQTSIRAIVFIAQQFTLAKSFDLGGIDYTDCVSLLVQIKSHGFAIRTSSFQTGMNRSGFVFGQPNTKLSKSFFAVSEPTMAEFVVD